MRTGTVALLSLLVLSTLPVVPANHTDLLADAGFSVRVLAGEAAAVSGRAVGGTAPYTYAWTYGGSGTRFASATSASTTFDTTGLSAGPSSLTLTVQDSLGDTVSDTVLIAIGASPVLVDQDVVIKAGVPDEIILVTPVDRTAINFVVPSGMARLEATLSWPDGDDLDLRLTGPGGVNSGAAGESEANPERVTMLSPAAGTWQASVKPFLSDGTTAHLTIQAFSGGAFPVPDVIAEPRPWGTLDSQLVLGRAKDGTAPYVVTWDLDNDGRYETTADWATVTKPAGTHLIPFKVTDATGYEIRGEAPHVVRNVQHAWFISCGEPGAVIIPTEYAQSEGTCWVHGGHHTYALPGTATLRAYQGIAFAVEQQYAPSIPNATTLAWDVTMQISMDGLTWTDVGTASYDVTEDRQYVHFDLDNIDQTFRFVRFHSPLSLTQGLSGFLDHTGGYLLMDDVNNTPPATTLAQQTRAYTCEEDLMEDFFATHPCWFGGIDRYDSASAFHTYVLGDNATADRIRGTFTLLPWRTDDWFLENSTTNATATWASLLTSADGMTWTEQARIPATYGLPTAFNVTLADADARFVRLFPEPHGGFDDYVADPALHHPRGYFVHSGIEVEGMLPL